MLYQLCIYWRKKKYITKANSHRRYIPVKLNLKTSLIINITMTYHPKECAAVRKVNANFNENFKHCASSSESYVRQKIRKTVREDYKDLGLTKRESEQVLMCDVGHMQSRQKHPNIAHKVENMCFENKKHNIQKQIRSATLQSVAAMQRTGYKKLEI